MNEQKRIIITKEHQTINRFVVRGSKDHNVQEPKYLARSPSLQPLMIRSWSQFSPDDAIYEWN